MTYTNDTARPQDAAIDLYRELVMLVDGEGRTTSRMVAKRFMKSHTHALRKLDQVFSEVKSIEPDMALLMFRESVYIDTRGRSQREVEITHDGFMMLAMRFTGSEATKWQLQFIAAFRWLAGMMVDRAENNRLMAAFEIKERKSVQDGSAHGRGLQLRKIEKRDLAGEESDIRAKVQSTLMLDAAGVH